MSRQNRVKKPIILDIKKEIISKRESGKSVGDLSAKCGVAKSRSGQFEKQGKNKKCTGCQANLLFKQTVGLEQITSKYIYFNVC